MTRKNLYIGCIAGTNPPPDGGHTFISPTFMCYCVSCKVRAAEITTECRRPLGEPLEIIDRSLNKPIYACETDRGTRGWWRADEQYHP